MFLVRLARGLGAVGIASVLVFAVPIHAQALAPAPPGAAQFVMGAVRAAAPAIAASSVVGPEGALIVSTVVAVGALAYVTRDTWMPWVSGVFGTGGNQSAAGGTSGYVASAFVDPAPGGVFGVMLSRTSGGHYGFEVKSQCRVGGVTAVGPGGAWYQSNGFAEATKSFPLQCPGLGQVVFFQMSAIPPRPAPSNLVSWGVPFDPQTDATYRVEASCRKVDGTLAAVSSVTVNPAGGGLLAPSCDQAFPGSHAESFKMLGKPTGGLDRQLWQQSVPDTSAALYPNCVGVGAIACTYVMEYLGVACVVGQAQCADWPRLETLHPADYQCRFGPYAITIAECGLLERSYEANGTHLTQANTDGNPNTWTAPGPSWAPNPGTDPGTAPGTGPVTPPAGAPGGAPAPVPGAQGNPTATQTNNSDCWPSGAAAWNPAEWVLQPIKCGLAWAFVPSTATVTALATTAQADFTAQGIAPIAAAVGANVAKVGGGSGCDGPPVTFEAVGVVKPMHPFSACSEPMATLARISYAVTTVVVVLGGGWAALVAVGAGFGFNLKRGGGLES